MDMVHLPREDTSGHGRQYCHHFGVKLVKFDIANAVFEPYYKHPMNIVSQHIVQPGFSSLMD